MELTIVQPNGWKKTDKFDKAVVRIGSAAANDIQLTGSGIIPIHLQVIHAPDTPGNCKVLNLGPAAQLESGGKKFTLESCTTVDVRDGDELILGEYRLLFHLPLTSEVIMSSRQISASLSLKDAVLRSNLPTTGFLRLKNLGAHPNCQFQVVVNGLSEACFRVDPLPILYPGAEEDVRIQFFHRSITPPAGYQVITISVTAPAGYPGEQVVIQQGLYVNPLLETGVLLGDDLPISRIDTPVVLRLADVNPTLPETRIATPVPGPESPPLPPSPDVDAQLPESTLETPVPTLSTMDGEGEPAGPVSEPSEPAVPIKKDISTTKVVRNPSETYWEETP